MPDLTVSELIREAELAEERFARKVAAYGIRAAILALVVVGLVAGTALEPVGWGLLWLVPATMAGSVGLDFLVRLITQERPEAPAE